MKKLTKERAYKLLLEAGKNNPGRYVEHSKRVGEAARKNCKKNGIRCG